MAYPVALLTLWYVVPLLKSQGVGWSLAVHSGLLTKTPVNVHGTEEGHGHGEVPHAELV